MRVVDQAVDEDARRVNFVGIELAGLDNNLRFRDGDFAAGGGDGVEVARGAAVDEVAVQVGLPGLDQRQVSHDAALEDVSHTVEVLELLAVGDHGAHAGARVEAGNAGAAGAHALGQRALGAELDFELAGKELALEFRVLAHIAGDHFFDLPRFEENAEAQPSTPALLLAAVRLRTPISRSAWMSA